MQTNLSEIRSAQLNSNDERATPYEVSSVRKALDILTAFSATEAEWSLSALSRRLGLPKSTAHNLLRTLQSFDLVQQDRERRVYRLGPRALELGLAFSQSSEVLAEARPTIRRIAERTRETVKLGVFSNDQVLIVAAIESTHQLHTRGDIGTRWPLHCTGLGKAILSALPLEECERLVQRRGLPQSTGRTFSTWRQLSIELDAVRARGYAMDLEENETGVRCVAAPIVDGLRGLVAAISVSGPRDRLEDERLAECAKYVVAAARNISNYSHLEES